MPTASKPSDRAQAEQDPPATDPAPEQKADTTPPQAYEYTAPFSTVYPPVPLTAHPAIPARKATDDDPGAPAQPATVFAWPDGAPDDRWQPTTKTPNQRPDNEPAQPTEA